jgi:hypothetical protein
MINPNPEDKLKRIVLTEILNEMSEVSKSIKSPQHPCVVDAAMKALNKLNDERVKLELELGDGFINGAIGGLDAATLHVMILENKWVQLQTYTTPEVQDEPLRWLEFEYMLLELTIPDGYSVEWGRHLSQMQYSISLWWDNAPVNPIFNMRFPFIESLLTPFNNEELSDEQIQVIQAKINLAVSKVRK